MMKERTEKYFLAFDESRSSGASEVGGKGKNLEILYRYGFSIPAGGVLISDAYRQFVTFNGLESSIHELTDIKADEVLNSEARLDRIRKKIQEGQMPDFIMKDLSDGLKDLKLLDKAAAVRSSAAAEDSASASFAGIHDSFLNVNGLGNILKAIKSCYASLWSPRAVAYRRKMNLTDDQVAAAVVIMELVPAAASGISFSCDPHTGRRDRISISANFGLGESVVGGSVEPDEYLLDPRTIIPRILEKKKGGKLQITQLKAEGTELVNTDNGTRKKHVLNDEEITELGLLTLRISEALGGGAQDIEWAFYEGRFSVLQARPVTSMPEPGFSEIKGQPVIWSNANLKEVMPQVMSTLTWNLSGCMLPRMLSAHLRYAGYHVPNGVNWVRLYKGRGYFNLSALQWEFYDAVGALPAMTNQYLGGHQPEIKVPEGNPYSGWKGIKRRLRGLNLFVNILRIQISADQIFKKIWKRSEEWNRFDFREMSDLELLSLMSEIRKEYTKYGPSYMILTSGASVPFEMAAKTLDKEFPGRGYSLANSILTGTCYEMTSAQHGYRLIELSEIARNDRDARSFFTDKDFKPLAYREKIPQNSRFRREFEKFLKEFGHRAIYETELLNPRWSEDPTYLLENIRSEILSPGNHDYRELRDTKKKTAEEEISGKFKWGIGRMMLNFWIDRTIKGSLMREMARSVMIKGHEPSRKMIQEIGRRFVERGILNEQIDMYHCTMAELTSIFKGYWDGSGLKNIVADRKKLHEEYSMMEPPDVIIDESPQIPSRSHNEDGQILQGIGVAGGQASGLARIIHHPGENSRLQTGDVLVAPSTDPGWTPLFLRAKALVMEVGGHLSHGSIVAREYGIPAVVNVPGVTKILEDGEPLTVDGDNGKVIRRR